jgi:hypothetical protein
MDELMDMIIGDETPTNISDKIKDVLYTKAHERVSAIKPSVSNNVFDDGEVKTEE